MRSLTHRRLMVASFALMIGLAGCASGGGGGGGGGANRLTAEDLAEYQQFDLFEVVRRIRGRWLSDRGRGTASVFVDGGQRQGGINELKTMRVTDVQELEFMSASNATMRFGTGHEGGAIMVTTRRR